MPPNILLLGAGFTRNWGGWLATEVRNRLGMLLEDHSQLRTLLNRHDNFEDALQELQSEFKKSPNANGVAPRLQAFQEAIVKTFTSMNRLLAHRPFEFCNDKNYSIASYLTRFDAIFTLNQDLLLERHYLTPNLILTKSDTRISRGEMPGMHPQPGHCPHVEDEALYTRYHPKGSFACAPGSQPYFKLHGSTNWFSNSGEQLMVMGGGKSQDIASHKILLWYAQKFGEYMSTPGARLTVIGYGFRDKHINDSIYLALEQRNLPMMIVGPSGRNLLKKGSQSYVGDTLGPPFPLNEITCFDSIRSLSSTFDGSDPLEHENLIDFLRLS